LVGDVRTTGGVVRIGLGAPSEKRTDGPDDDSEPADVAPFILLALWLPASDPPTRGKSKGRLPRAVIARRQQFRLLGRIGSALAPYT